MILIRGVNVPVATTGHLIAMKLIARDDQRRPRDRDDLVQLSGVADRLAWSQAETAVDLITERGLSRKRDLRSCGMAIAKRRSRLMPITSTTSDTQSRPLSCVAQVKAAARRYLADPSPG